MPLNRMKFMNTYIDNVTESEAIGHIERCIAERRICQVVTPNVDHIIKIEANKYLADIYKNAELLLTDGHPLLWIAKWYKTPIKEKISGSDFSLVLCQVAEEKGYSIFLLGGAPGVADRAAEKLIERHPKLNIAGTYSPPYGFEKDTLEIEKIDRLLLESKADILFVCLGAPKQEIFVYENMNQYQIPVSLCVGATIDFIAGEVKRAPKWMTNHGFEWFYRFLQEPKRMFKRYFIDDTKIVWLAWKYRKSNAAQ